jgi:hypothetical protein
MLVTFLKATPTGLMVDGADEVSRKKTAMKTDGQYIAELDALYQKHLTWNHQQVIDIFKAENGSLNEEDVVRLFNKWITKRTAPRD